MSSDNKVRIIDSATPTDFAAAEEAHKADPRSKIPDYKGEIARPDPEISGEIFGGMSPAFEQNQPLITNVFTHEARIKIAEFLREHDVINLTVTESGFSLENGSPVSDAAVMTLIHSNFIWFERLLGFDESLRH